jgi:hypothetical protein
VPWGALDTVFPYSLNKLCWTAVEHPSMREDPGHVYLWVTEQNFTHATLSQKHVHVTSYPQTRFCPTCPGMSWKNCRIIGGRALSSNCFTLLRARWRLERQNIILSVFVVKLPWCGVRSGLWPVHLRSTKFGTFPGPISSLSAREKSCLMQRSN